MRKLLMAGLFGVFAANATITPDLLVISNAGPYCTPAAGGECTYEYEAHLPQKHYLETGDFFTIYDFLGFAGSIVGPSGWTGVPNLIGITPGSPVSLPDVDDPTTVNITWIYNGPRVDGATTFTGFKVNSIFNGVAPGWYASQTHKSSGVTVGGTTDSNAGQVDVPSPGGGDTVVPEPMSMGLLGSGLTALGLLSLRKNRK